MKVKVDKGSSTCLGVCACGDRFLAMSHERALQRLVQHEQAVHPTDRHARAAMASWAKRHAADL